MSDRISIESVPKVPYINEGDDVGAVLVEAAAAAGFTFQPNDVVCVASKAVSVAEGRRLALADVEPSDLAHQIHEKIPRKDPRLIQTIINQTGAPDGSRLELAENYIGGWLPNGMRLTSAGVDKLSADEVILLPEDPDKSARDIGTAILKATGVQVGVIITDSDGRVEKAGSMQLAIGLYGVPALRVSESTNEAGKVSRSEETICDLLAASAALLMGQRGTNKPAVVIRGFRYDFSPDSSIRDSLSRPE